jgi:hypothetical protein
MATLLESAAGMLTPDVVGQIGKAIGVDSSLVQQGMNAVGPTVLGSLSKTASAPGGADSILKALPTDAAGSGSDLLSSLLGNLSGGGTSADMMQNVLGSGVNAISGTLSKSLGFDVGPLMKLGVPLLAGLLTKTVKDKKLDAGGVASLLKDESAAYAANPANKATSELAQSALKAGEAAAALRKTYSDAEWNKVRGAPVAAMYLVATASPSKGTGAVEELGAAAGAVAESIKQASPTSVIGTAFGGGMTQAEVELLKQDAPPRERILGIISGGLAAVKAHSPGDATAYRNMVMEVAQKTAAAAKEGGFLGIGGTQVSAEEQAALNDITAALA